MLFEKVKELAQKKSKSLKQIALELGLSENAFYKWKTQSPKSETLQRVAEYFNVSTDYLLGRTEDEFSHIQTITESDLYQNFRNRPIVEEFIKEISASDDETIQEMKNLLDFIRKKSS